MTPFSPENMQRFGKWMQGAGKGLGTARDFARDVKEKVTPHVERGVEKLDKAFFGDKQSGREGLVDQLKTLGERLKGGYQTEGVTNSHPAFELKTSKHPNLSDAEYTVFDAVVTISTEKKTDESRATKGQGPAIKPGEIGAFTGQEEGVVTRAIFKLESMGLITPKTVKSEAASLPIIATIKLTTVGQTVFDRCNQEPKVKEV